MRLRSTGGWRPGSGLRDGKQLWESSCTVDWQAGAVLDRASRLRR